MKKSLIAVFLFTMFCSCSDSTFEIIVCSHYSASYGGKVHKKIQQKDGMDVQRLIISSRKQDTIVLVLDMEQPALFETIISGDSIFKEENTLKIRLKKSDRDTIFTLQYNNSIYGEKAPSYIERIVNNCSNDES